MGTVVEPPLRAVVPSGRVRIARSWPRTHTQAPGHSAASLGYTSTLSGTAGSLGDPRDNCPEKVPRSGWLCSWAAWAERERVSIALRQWTFLLSECRLCGLKMDIHYSCKTFMYLKGTVAEREGNRGMGFPSIRYIPPNHCNDQGWTKPEAGAWNSIGVSHRGGQGRGVGAVLCCFPRCLSRESEWKWNN